MDILPLACEDGYSEVGLFEHLSISKKQIGTCIRAANQLLRSLLT